MIDFLQSYIETARWAEFLDNPRLELAQETLDILQTDCQVFCAIPEVQSAIETYGEDKVAHDFWLTRNGHGAGFWDGDYEESLGLRLTNLCRSFPEVYLYTGDDNLIYLM